MEACCLQYEGRKSGIEDPTVKLHTQAVIFIKRSNNRFRLSKHSVLHTYLMPKYMRQ